MLVADDFGSFRNIVNGMLLSLGVNRIAMASSAQDTIDLCVDRQFDVILCDYNIGEGRSGQHVLEELRHKQLISRRTVFIIVSAEASRNIVMSAYDCEPDDYLMKPITAHMLEQRMSRLLLQRQAFRSVYTALENDQFYLAIDLLTDMSLVDNRHSVMAQKMLGDLFIQQNDFEKAEKLYTKALEVRQLDWARLGLAKVKQLMGNLDVAGVWLDRIVEDNPLFLPAYDVLADNWIAKGNNSEAQKIVERSVEVSPMSILRQKNLAKLAVDNDDLTTAIKACRHTIQLGKLSCHGSAEDSIQFAKTVLHAAGGNLDLSSSILMEAAQSLDHVQEYYPVDSKMLAQTHLLASRVYAVQGNRSLAEERLHSAEIAMDGQHYGIDMELERVASLQALGDHVRADKLLAQLMNDFSQNQAALEKLDLLLNEPVSKSNLELIATVNREGIGLYSAGEFDEAIACFDQARKQFPRHMGLLLNIVQALVGKLKRVPSDDVVLQECADSLALAASLIDEKHDHYQRYLRLRDMAKDAMKLGSMYEK